MKLGHNNKILTDIYASGFYVFVGRLTKTRRSLKALKLGKFRVTIKEIDTLNVL
jgi:hypothetical protein